MRIYPVFRKAHCIISNRNFNISKIFQHFARDFSSINWFPLNSCLCHFLYCQSFRIFTVLLPVSQAAHHLWFASSRTSIHLLFIMVFILSLGHFLLFSPLTFSRLVTSVVFCDLACFYISLNLFSLLFYFKLSYLIMSSS